MQARHVAAVAVVLLVAACGRQEPAGNNLSAASAGGNAGVAAGNATVANNTAAPPAAPQNLVLAGTGILPALAFGTGRAEAVATATAAFGAPTGTGESDECGEGPMQFVDFGDLQLAFQEGRLAGWSLDGNRPALRTAQGLAVGAPKSALGDAQIDRESTLGPEFAIEDVGGILDEREQRVEALWAGLVCQFR